MHDSYGDSWNGATLEVLINNFSVGNYSASNFGSMASFSVCNGDSLDLIYTAGDNENENSAVARTQINPHNMPAASTRALGWMFNNNIFLHVTN